MCGEFKGCAAIVQKSYPQAIYVHCANHNLNLALSHACKIPPIRNCIGSMKEVVNFFRLSTKAGLALKDHITASCPTAKQTRLLKFCETRWVEHLESLSLFCEVYEHTCSALEELDEKNTKTDGVKPHALLASIRTPQFIIALTVLKPIFSLTRNLSLFLQREDCDLSRCVDYANNLHEELDEMRRNAETTFKDMFNAAQKIAEKVDVNLVVPRLAGRQKNRDNYEGGPEEYFRSSILIPFLDHLLEQLESRFLKHRELLSKIQNILPYKCTELDSEGIRATVATFEAEWPNDMTGSVDDFVAEFTMWRRYTILNTKFVSFWSILNRILVSDIVQTCRKRNFR